MGDAIPVDDFVWCLVCGEPHPADLDAEPPHIQWTDPDECSAIEPALHRVTPLPEDWESKYIAMYSDYDHKAGVQYYDLWLKEPPLLEYHRPMVYVDKKRS